MKKFLFVFLTVAFLFSCSDDDAEQTGNSIVDIASGDAQFSTLVSALDRTGLVPTLAGEGSFTVFAPTDAAFNALGVDLNTLTDAQLTDILLYHVVGSEIASSAIGEGQTYVSSASTSAPNGGALSLLVEKAGTGVTINNAAEVVSADIQASNGVIHVIDQVLLPLDVVGHASANSNFTSLVGALAAAPGDLVSVLSGDGPFTVFAPLNSAFEAIADVAATLTGDQLASVLTYHVVSGNVMSTELSNGMTAPTVNGEMIEFNISGGNVSVIDANGNASNVVLTDVQATNGVIHVIDSVILPENL